MSAGEVKQDFWLNCYCPVSTCTRNWVCPAGEAICHPGCSCEGRYISQSHLFGFTPEEWLFISQKKRVGVKVASFKDKVVMETVRIYFGREAYVKMLCNFLAEKTEYEQPFSIC